MLTEPTLSLKAYRDLTLVARDGLNKWLQILPCWWLIIYSKLTEIVGR